MTVGPDWLALGTVQFGLPYGIAGRQEAVPPDEVRAILERAAAGGVRHLDTAPVYGSIEARLDALCAGLPFGVTSKIPAVTDDDPAGAVRASVELSRRRLGSRLTELLFHRAEDLLRSDADSLVRAAVDAAGPAVRIGVSGYEPELVMTLCERFGLFVAQVPANALDQRLAGAPVAGRAEHIELHARSVFLQGLLLMPPADVARRLPCARESHGRWWDWCRAEQVSPASAAMAAALALPGVRRCVVGVDRLDQLCDILDATKRTMPRLVPSLACVDPDVIDPRRWAAWPPSVGE